MSASRNSKNDGKSFRDFSASEYKFLKTFHVDIFEND